MISSDYFYNLLDKICLLQNDKYYTINNDAFKKMKLLNLYEELTEKLKPYYKPSRHYYVERPAKYNYFTTLVRHICKNNEIMYSSKIKYDKSKYEIIYYIYKIH